MINKNKVKELLKEGKNATEIAEQLEEKPSAVRKCISRNFKDIQENNKREMIESVRKLYKKGYTSQEIERKLNIPDSTIRNYLAEHCKDLKGLHEGNLKERKKIKRECKRVLTRENNKEMSTEALVRANIQSYRSDGNKYIFDYKTRGKRPLDLPRTFVFHA
ncbi:hypothetical protein [uncultured Clostridium sp.]|uniref:hypothetical protein n=1 Tax=uncultured Clostridium sp. TaxID=59620 RepID=UPI00258F8314|nr:hypothetical protein [uncultured Clostridium sp.]